MSVAAYGALSDETGQKEYRVEALSAASGAVLARIEGVADRTAAEALRGLRLYVERSALPATGEREWYEADWSASRRSAGTAGIGARWWPSTISAPGRRWRCRRRDSGVMLPFTDEVVPEIDVEGGKVVVDPPAGLLAGGQEKEARDTCGARRR